MRGRKPKPTARQIAEGDPRRKGKHKLIEKLKAEPNARRGLPGCPPHLSGRARAAWEFWAEELGVMNIDSRPDAQMLEGACVNYSRAVQADLMLAEQGITVTESKITESGEVIVLKIRKHPAVEVSNAAWRQLRAFCSEFGLSPASRTRLAIDKADQNGQELAELLSKPRPPRTTATVH
jgi:P27 family predicted phage terminase small subunit